MSQLLVEDCTKTESERGLETLVRKKMYEDEERKENKNPSHEEDK